MRNGQTDKRTKAGAGGPAQQSSHTLASGGGQVHSQCVVLRADTEDPVDLISVGSDVKAANHRNAICWREETAEDVKQGRLEYMRGASQIVSRIRLKCNGK